MNTLRMISLLGALAAAATTPSIFATQSPPVAVTAQSDVQTALDTLQLLLSAYASGNQKQLEDLVDPTMIGYSRVVDAVRDAAISQRQMRVNLVDIRTQISENVVIVQTHWQKRFISRSRRTAGSKNGQCTFVLRREANVWSLSALSGDNPFGAD